MHTPTSCMRIPPLLSPPGLYGLPKRNGKLKDISHFDAAFFGVHSKQANTMDPQLRLMMEVAYEAILDGGEEPKARWRLARAKSVRNAVEPLTEGWPRKP